MSKGAFLAWFGGIGGGVVLVLALVPSVLRFVPDRLINLPEREYWLDPVRRGEAFSRLSAWMSGMAAALGWFMVAVMELVLRSNLRRAPLESGVFLALMAVFLVVFGALLVGLFRSFRRPR